MININLKKIFTVSIGILVGISMLMGTFDVYKGMSASDSMLKSVISASASLFALNRIVKSELSQNNPLETQEKTKSTKTAKANKLLLMTLNSSMHAFSSSLSFVLMSIVFLFGLFVYFKNRKGSENAPPGQMFYLRWRSGFIDPVRKCVICLANKYAMNPISLTGGLYNSLKINPHFVNIMKCGFFLSYFCRIHCYKGDIK